MGRRRGLAGRERFRQMNKDAAKKPAGSNAQKGKRERAQIGWREWAGLPELGVEKINAKIDTGAKSSALHAFRIKEIDVDGEPYVEFYVHPLQRRKKPELFCRAPVSDKRIIRSSNGQEEERFVIRTPLSLGGRLWKIDLTLTNRDSMGFRMLVGRDALRRKFIIDPGASYLLGAPPKSGSKK